MKMSDNVLNISVMERSLTDQVLVIITTRNRIAELTYTVDHCLKLGLKPDQIMITDDASTDSTARIIRDDYPGVRLHVNSIPRGYIHNRNAMMKRADRAFILSLDDDSNLVSIQDLINALRLLNSDETYAVFSFGVFEQKQPPVIKPYREAVDFYKSYIGCGHIIKRDALKKVGYYREELHFYGEEIDFSIRCYQAGLKIVGIPGVLVHHRIDLLERERQFKSDNSRGEYSVIWRSSFSISNTLLKILMYYPSGLLPFYLIKSLLGQFYLYHFVRNQSRSYWRGLNRWFKLCSYGLRERRPFSVRQFKSWDKLPLYISYK